MFSVVTWRSFPQKTAGRTFSLKTAGVIWVLGVFCVYVYIYIRFNFLYDTGNTEFQHFFGKKTIAPKKCACAKAIVTTLSTVLFLQICGFWEWEWILGFWRTLATMKGTCRRHTVPIFFIFPTCNHYNPHVHIGTCLTNNTQNGAWSICLVDDLEANPPFPKEFGCMLIPHLWQPTCNKLPWTPTKWNSSSTSICLNLIITVSELVR